ncbi:mucoidy inhibitor MuiA family protein [Chelatococcus sp. SYSU_G07232]|uniref:Mucoidy inhibitor MuiA family protein n=1 Tax=Chelatococcus albus TaxID=3047466 RepID=A0ABT7AFX0_9HYPH|nr:mucoidy inhibitor MuiA family protein [Chelatococcus sp. SYSU_G07232]MDJ1158228.1 mucoidy inhibitor MuiA family protein [Chelatococcus sp. SYSU_G07232]
MRSASPIGLFILIALPAHAADIETTARIDRVTVHPDGASVTRIATIDLPAGATTLVLKALPGAIDPASIRVAGEGTGRFSIGAVETRAVAGDPKGGLDPTIAARLRTLRDAHEGLAGKIEAAEGKKAAITRYAQAGPEKLSPESKPLEVAQWPAAWDAIGTALAQVNEDLRGLRGRARDIAAEIEALERARPRAADAGAPRLDVIVSLEAAAPVKGTLSLTYRVGGVSWRPLYDVRLDTGGGTTKPALELVRRAQVIQRTGEDWADVALTVSTVRVARGTAAPDLPPALVAFYEPPVAYERGAAPPGALRRAESLPHPPMTSGPAPAGETADQAVAAAEREAIADVGVFQASFVLPGRVDVPREGATRSFRVASRTLAPALSVKAVPVLDETAYLQASFVNEDDMPLLPGEVALHRDGVFVGRGTLPLVAPGDKVELGFGADDKVKVTRVAERRRENEPGFLGSTRSDQREFKTTVRNLHAFPMRITILDRMPYSENAAITVEALPQGTPPTEKSVGDRRGVMVWTYDYAAGEQREIRLAYRLKWPADRELLMEPRPVAPPQPAR